MIIKNYGRYWERQSINWGKQGRGQKGHLKGYLRVRNKPADFRDQIGIYLLHDDNLNVVYVGQTGSQRKRLFDRLKDHETDHLWNRWKHFSWFGFRGVNTASSKLSDHDKVAKVFKETGAGLLDQMEGILIAATEPKLNKQGARWREAEEYFQLIDDDLEVPSPQYLAKKLEVIETALSDLSSQIALKK